MDRNPPPLRGMGGRGESRGPGLRPGLVILSMFVVLAGCSQSPDSALEARLMTHVEKLVSFGPRTPDSPGSSAARAYLSEELKKSGYEVIPESFLASTPNLPSRVRTAARCLSTSMEGMIRKSGTTKYSA